MKLVSLPLSALIPAPGNRRVDQVEELAASISRLGRMLQPPVVREVSPGRWEIIAGHRRIAAARLLRWLECMCIVLSDVDDPELLRLAENVARRNLAPFELCEAVYQQRQQSRPELEIAQALALSVPYIRNLCRVRASLIPEVWEVFKRQGRNARISEFVALAGRPARVQRAAVLGGPVSNDHGAIRRPSKADLRAKLDALDETDPRAATLRWALGFGDWPEAC